MATMKELFVTAVNEGFKSAKAISDPYQKTVAYAEIAKALANTGLVGVNISEVSADAPAEAAAPAKNESKESLKPAATKGKAPAKAEPKKEEKAPEPAPVAEEKEPELEEEWTDAMIELKEAQIKKMNGFVEEHGEEAVNQCVSMFSEGLLTTKDQITPLNIDAFVAFMEELAKQA